MRHFPKALVLASGVALGLACGDSSSLVAPTPADPINPGSSVPPAQTITFEGHPPGTILSQVFADGGAGPIAVFGRNPNFPLDVNTALIFDSSHPTPGERDLGTPHQDFGGPGRGGGGAPGRPFPNDRPLGNILIVARDLDDADGDGLVDQPDSEAEKGSTLSFNFSSLEGGDVTLEAITIMDIESNEPRVRVELYDTFDVLMRVFTLARVGDNGVGSFSLGDTEGVGRMSVVLNGSGALDEIVFIP